MNYELIVKNIRGELKSYIQRNNIKSLVIGISGGMDSCLCAALAKPVCDALSIPLIGRSLPILSNSPDEIYRAKETGETFCTSFKEHKILEVYYERMASELNTDMGDDFDSSKAWKIRNGNIKARLRMIYLYNLASQNNGMVLSTDNYTEYMLGFWTLHGDVGDYGMIQEFWKSEAYEMAEWLATYEYAGKASQILIDTINAMATDGLGITSKGDLGQILPEWTGYSRDGYREVDSILQEWESLQDVDFYTPEITNRIKELKNSEVIQRHLASQFKRSNPVNINRNIILY